MLGPVELVAEIDSTNRVLLDQARAGAPEGRVLVADHQTDGRGRLDRSWDAPPGSSLLASVLFRPALSVADAHLVTFAAGLAAVEACADAAGIRPTLKWPNDVVVDVDGVTRKLAGLLAESIVSGDALEAVVVGMGLNVSWPEPPPDGGIALNELVGVDVDRPALLTSWLAHLHERYQTLGSAEGRSAVVEDYRVACSTIGRSVRVEQTDGAFLGVAEAVDDAGHLVVRSATEQRMFAVGDVVHVRPDAG